MPVDSCFARFADKCTLVCKRYSGFAKYGAKSRLKLWCTLDLPSQRIHSGT